MRKSALFALSCVLALGQLATAAVTPEPNQKRVGEDVPPIIVSGMTAYKEKGPEDAVRAWIKGSPLDGSKEALSQANMLRQIQDFYGAYRGFDVISTRDLSPRIRIVYLALDFDKGPLFAKFLVYKTEEGWILTSFNFNTKEEAVLPTLP
jgi:hypothetical protein